jgi:hypothetical protein
VPDAVSGEGIEAQRFGPVLATAFGSEPEEPALNRIQGAGEPGAVSERHLGDAIEWMRSREVEYRVPLLEGRPETPQAEEWLGGEGLERGATWPRLVRDATPPDAGEDPRIEVFELTEETAGEGFSHLIREAADLPTMAETLFFGLPVEPSWRCYTALLAGEGRGVVAAGAMRIEDGVAMLGLDATLPGDWGRGCNKALLRRRLLDAAEAGCGTVVAELGDCDPDSLAAARHNLLEAGFVESAVGHAWQRPALLPAGVALS